MLGCVREPEDRRRRRIPISLFLKGWHEKPVNAAASLHTTPFYAERGVREFKINLTFGPLASP